MQFGGEDKNWIALLVILIASLWGGAVSYVGRLRRGEVKLSKAAQELLIDLFISSFAGSMIGLALWAAGCDLMLCFAVSGIGGHAGARLIFKLERLLFNRVDSFNDKP